jgi:hypothetical protein
MKECLVEVTVTYNGRRCKNLWYLPGDEVGDIREGILERHPLTSFKLLDEEKRELADDVKLNRQHRYEIVCWYGKFNWTRTVGNLEH